MPPLLKILHGSHLTCWKSHSPPRSLRILPSHPILTSSHPSPCSLHSRLMASSSEPEMAQPQSLCIDCLPFSQVTTLPPPPPLRPFPLVSQPLFPVPLANVACCSFSLGSTWMPPMLLCFHVSCLSPTLDVSSSRAGTLNWAVPPVYPAPTYSTARGWERRS